MGQKVHPLGFRVGITKKHQSQWFARFNKYKYSQSVLEDTMLRKTLINLFPELLNPVLKKMQKREDDITITPRITQIKIERGLIPYEIGIQIHAENCELLKVAIDKLKVNRELVSKLQKARRYLLSLQSKIKDIGTITENGLYQTGHLSPENSAAKNLTGQQTNKKNKLETKRGSRLNKKTSGRSPFLRLSKLSRQEQRRQRIIKKRLKKRQSIRRRYRQLIAKSLFIKKTGNKIIKKLTFKNKRSKRNFVDRRSQNQKNTRNLTQQTSQQPLLQQKKLRSRDNAVAISNKKVKTVTNAFSSRLKKKFVTIFINKMKKNFFKKLKENLIFWHEQMQANQQFAPLGYNKKWSLNRLASLKTYSFSKLNKIISVLEKKSLVKLESLRKEFIVFGSISKIQSFGYYQVVNFLKNLKELVNKLKREQKLQFAINKLSRDGKLSAAKNGVRKDSTSSPVTKLKNIQALKFKQNLNFISSVDKNISLKETVLRKKLNNIEGECRQIKFIEYLKDLVKKHRTENIYFYLSTIADARRNLRKIKLFTKHHANFLFGLNLKSFIQTKAISSSQGEGSNFDLESKVTEHLNKVLDKSTRKVDLEKNLQDIFLEQLEKQRNLFQENAQLIPKISIKFYSVNSEALKSKASIISDSVVDALEKRKSFRSVIKKAKKDLMKTAGVKGVKIQVAGRLNGAEIARTEWVRAGRVPLQTLRANLDYSYRTASTIYGIIGVKVWIFKGYTKLITQ